ncbi:MAG: hypothetical protein ACREID_08725, partial [Planctomycetota bacterium]
MLPARVWAALLLLSAPALRAQDSEGCDEETVITVGGGEPAEEELLLEEEPADEAPPEMDPNRPPALQVGSWEPPALSAEDRARRDRLVARRGEKPGEAAAAYELAEFYLARGWGP